MASAISAQVKKACPCLPQLRAGDEGLGLPHGATRTPFKTLLYVFIAQCGQQLNILECMACSSPGEPLLLPMLPSSKTPAD